MKAILWAMLSAAIFGGIQGLNNEDGETKHLADDENLDVSQAMGDIVTTGTMNIEADNNDVLPDSHNTVHDLEKRAVELKKLHPIVKHTDEQQKGVDAKHEHTLYLCQRDYKQPCPLGFRHVVSDDGENRCIAPRSYTGPCMGQDLVYREMHEEEKVAWAQDCLANWPCVQCKRRYSDLCPEKWELKATDTSQHTCRATEDYEGPCKDEMVSFIRFNIEMQKQWSRRCHAWWPCDTSAKVGQPPDAELPITLGATLYRMTL